MSRTAVVVFDLDGTVLDTEPLSTRAIDAVIAEEAGFPDRTVSPALKAKIVGMRDEDWARLILDALEVPESALTVEGLVAGWRRNMTALVSEHVDFMPGAAELIRALHARGVPLAIATSCSRDQCIAKFKNHQRFFDDHFLAVVSGDEVKNGKPEPDIFLEAARRLNADPARAVVVEDSPFGVTAGNAAGMKTIAVSEADMDHATLSLRTLVGVTPDDVLALVK